MNEDGISRRTVLVNIGLLFNGIIAVIIGVPVIRYLLSPIFRGRKPGYDSWLELGEISQFPAGQTRLATYRNPITNPWDGATADIACWVRNIDGTKFQVFAVNCAHLGCPVRWFPQSQLFLCPCHGGVYYQDGSRASGPPERGLFEWPYRIDNGKLFIEAGQMPTPGLAANSAAAKLKCV